MRRTANEYDMAVKHPWWQHLHFHKSFILVQCGAKFVVGSKGSKRENCRDKIGSMVSRLYTNSF